MSSKIEHLFHCGIISELLIDAVLKHKEGVGVVAGVLLGHLSPVLLRPLELPQHRLAHALVHEVVGDVLLPYSGSQYHISPLCATRTVAIDLRLRDTDTERELLSGFVPTASMSINQMRLGYTKENAVPCCWMCNHAKGAAPVEEFLSWCARIAEVHRAE